MPYTRVNDVNLYYEQRGAGPDLVLIMGLGGHVGGWGYQRPTFEPHFRVTVFDTRGAGRSDAPDEPYSVPAIADDTAALMESLGIARAHILGVSFGGMVAQELAITYPAKVEKLVLSSSRADMGAIRPLMAPAERGLREAGVDHVAISLLTMPWFMSRAFCADDAKVAAWVEALRRNPYPPKPYAFRRLYDAMLAHDTRDRLAQIAAPTLVIVGAEDILTPVAASEYLAAHIPNATLRVLPRGAHFVNSECPADYNAAVLEFLQG